MIFLKLGLLNLMIPYSTEHILICFTGLTSFLIFLILGFIILNFFVDSESRQKVGAWANENGKKVVLVIVCNVGR
jgi:hypothetical protein